MNREREEEVEEVSGCARKTGRGGGGARQKFKKDKVMRERGVEGEKWWLGGGERRRFPSCLLFIRFFLKKKNLI